MIRYVNNQVKEVNYKKAVIAISTMILVGLITARYNIVYAMEQQKDMIATVINNGNVNIAQQFLNMIKENDLTDNQYREINRMINERLQELNPDTNYRLNQDLAIQNQNTGIPGDVEPTTTFRHILIGLSIFASISLAVYIIYQYWDDLRNLLPDGTRITGTLLQQVTLRNFQLIMHDEVFVERLHARIITTIQD